MKHLGFVLIVFLMVSLVTTSGWVQIPRVKAQEEGGSFGNPVDPPYVNWTRFWKVFNAHSAWDLEYNNGSGWISDKSQLQVIKNKTAFWKIKITLNFTASYNADYRLTFGIDLDVKNYTYRESKWKYVISYKNHTVFFDFSDLAEISGLTITHGIKPVGDESWFWFRIRRNNVPQGYNIVLDPSFGHDTAEGSNDSVNNYITGSAFTISESGTADSISVWICSTAERSAKCAIYYASNDSLVANSATDEITDTLGGGCAPSYWENFTYSGSAPSFVADTEYILVCWTSGTAFMHYHANTTNDQGHKTGWQSYNGFPSSPTFTHYEREYSIYCNYTVSGAPQEYEYNLTGTVQPSTSLDYDAEKDFEQTETVQPTDALSALGEALHILPGTITPISAILFLKEIIVWITHTITVTPSMQMDKETVSAFFELVESVHTQSVLTWLIEKVFTPSAIINLDSALQFGKETFEQIHEFLETVNPLDALSKTLEGLAVPSISVLSISFAVIALAIAFCALALVIKRREGEE